MERWVGPHENHKGSYKIEEGGKGIKEGDMTIELEIRVMQPWATKCVWPPETRQDKEQILSYSLQKKHSAADLF